MTTVDDQIASQLATLTRATAQPVAPFAYGRDLSCTTTLAGDLAEVDPTSVRAIGEALIRRLITPNGSLLDDPDYGEDIRAALNRGTAQADLLRLAGRVRNEICKDDRVESANVTCAFATGARTLTIAALVVPADPNLTDFKLTLAVQDGALMIEAFG